MQYRCVLKSCYDLQVMSVIDLAYFSRLVRSIHLSCSLHSIINEWNYIKRSNNLLNSLFLISSSNTPSKLRHNWTIIQWYSNIWNWNPFVNLDCLSSADWSASFRLRSNSRHTRCRRVGFPAINPTRLHSLLALFSSFEQWQSLYFAFHSRVIVARKSSLLVCFCWKTVDL